VLVFQISLWVLFFSSPLLQAQTNDETAIREAVQFYYDGYLKADSTILLKAFDMEAGTMKIVRSEAGRPEETRSIFISEAIRRWSSREPFSSKEVKMSFVKILSTDIVDGKMAVSKVDVKFGEKRYIDYLSLYKTNGLWRIVNKIFVDKKN
jgi:hypothetical protein